MKIVTKTKILSWLELNKLKILMFVVFVITLMLFNYMHKYINANDLPPVFNNAGLVGSLLGALVGSMTSFIGVIFTQRKQSESQAMIAKKNTIYRPLYDELVKIREILKINSFPAHFAFEAGWQTMLPHPQFGAWERIKTDSRRIQVPKYLDELLEEYTVTVNKYLKSRPKSALDTQVEINKILEEKFNTQTTIKNLGDVLLGTILENNRDRSIMKNYVNNALNPKLNITDEDLLILDNLIYERCNEIESVKETKRIYNVSLDELDNIIGCLTIIIDLVNKKFEAYNHKYF